MEQETERENRYELNVIIKQRILNAMSCKSRIAQNSHPPSDNRGFPINAAEA